MIYVYCMQGVKLKAPHILWNLTGNPKSFLLRRDGEEFEVMLPEDVKPGEQVSVTLEEVRLKVI